MFDLLMGGVEGFDRYEVRRGRSKKSARIARSNRARTLREPDTAEGFAHLRATHAEACKPSSTSTLNGSLGFVRSLVGFLWRFGGRLVM